MIAADSIPTCLAEDHVGQKYQNRVVDLGVIYLHSIFYFVIHPPPNHDLLTFSRYLQIFRPILDFKLNTPNLRAHLVGTRTNGLPLPLHFVPRRPTNRRRIIQWIHIPLLRRRHERRRPIYITTDLPTPSPPSALSAVAVPLVLLLLLLLRRPCIRTRVPTHSLPVPAGGRGAGLTDLRRMFFHDVQDARVLLSLLHQVLVLRPEDAADRADRELEHDDDGQRHERGEPPRRPGSEVVNKRVADNVWPRSGDICDVLVNGPEARHHTP